MKHSVFLATTLIVFFGLILKPEYGLWNNATKYIEVAKPTTTANITCPSDIVVSADAGECGAIVNFPDATVTGVSSADQIIMRFQGDPLALPVYEEEGMRLQGFDRDHIDAPWPIPCDNRQGALIHPSTGNTWTYNGGEPFTPNRVYVCSTNMVFKTGDCGTEFVPTQTGDVDFPDTPEWQNITSMTWEETGGTIDASIDNFRFTPTSVKQTAGLESGCFFPVGTTPVTFTAIDDNGVETSCSFNVTVLDQEAPQFTVRNISLSLENTSSVKIAPDDILVDPAFDNCGIKDISLSKDTFFCTDTGDNPVEITVTDINGNVTRDAAIVTITGNGSSGAIDDIPDGDYCDSFTFPAITGVALSGNEAFYSQVDGNGIKYSAGDIINFDAAVTYPVTYYIYDDAPSTNGCKNQVSFDVNILPTPMLDPVADVLVCETYVFPEIKGEKLSGNEAYYTESGGNGTKYNSGETIHIDKALTYPLTFYVYDVNSANCFSERNFDLDLTVCDVKVEVEASTTVICDNDMDVVTITAKPFAPVSDSNYVYEWRQDGNLNVIATTPQIEVLPFTSTTYQVTATDPSSRAAVTSDKASITIVVNEAPIAPSIIDVAQCDDPENGIGIEFINLNDYDGQVTMGIEDLDITYHLNQNDADNSLNSISNTLEITTGENVIYARLTNPNTGCYSTTILTFELFKAPELIIDPTSVSLCETTNGEFLSTVIRTNLSIEDYDFIWTVETESGTELLTDATAQLQVNEAGVYTVEAINKMTGCTAKATATVDTVLNPIQATANAELTAVLNNHVINVEVEATMDQETTYQVMLGDGSWYDMNEFNGSYTYTFRGVETGNGIQTIQLRDSNGCWTQTLEVITLGIPQFVTPNNDGYNDTWNIKGLEVLDQDSKLYVFDRYGKLLADLTLDQQGWNGVFNGEPLPSTDYWYRLELEDGRTVSGHFSLKR
ncbi:T9SS type B sorting domain-containing protein [Nonlabens sp. YIK11]|uniref:T9SS type B sorting domain-containing protein n=1 Tax=Nonlabens sp. YIK11 TaxID=1453349 RepID=UPI000AA73CD5|nr:T9SS type B sorting domain-containing protein [Nonlabens sp. YIK11]